MTDPTAQEPTMEEILASIRRIISEDDAPAAAPEPVAAPEPEPAPFMAAPTPEPTPAPPEPEEDVLELTDVYEAPEAESIGDLDVFAPEPEPAATPAPAPAYDALVGESAAASAASAFAGLAASLKKPEPEPMSASSDLNFVSGSTVEGMVAQMLRPMIKDWLDANLPGIVETAVKAEVERIARSAT